jgi:two-component system, NtrC family, response regulator HydG
MRHEPTILVVDDNPDLLETFALILKRRGFSVETAGSGAAAIAKFRQHNFDVTLMDIVMPEVDGVAAFRQIREIEPGAPVILMTAYSDDDILRAAHDEGARCIINKPIHIDMLLKLINEATATKPILIIDDDPDICDSLTKVFQQQGYEVLTAGSGEEAIIIASEKACRMAFIDVKLPNIDGLETLLRLKQISPDLLPIMMTGFRNEVKDALDRAQQESVITCLYKPFDPAEAVWLVEKIGKKAARPEDK